jgi:hypothetical protein
MKTHFGFVLAAIRGCRDGSMSFDECDRGAFRTRCGSNSEYKIDCSTNWRMSLRNRKLNAEIFQTNRRMMQDFRGGRSKSPSLLTAEIVKKIEQHKRKKCKIRMVENTGCEKYSC